VAAGILPAVEGGILPPGKNAGWVKRPNGPVVFFAATPFRRAGSPGSTSAKMADATIFRPALSRKHSVETTDGHGLTRMEPGKTTLLMTATQRHPAPPFDGWAQWKTPNLPL